MRTDKEKIELFVRESQAIAGEPFSLDDVATQRHFMVAKIVAEGFRFGQVELHNAALSGVSERWLREGVSTRDRDRVPVARYLPALLNEWDVWVQDGLHSLHTAPEEAKDAFAWKVHDELICLRLFKDNNGKTARLMLNNARQHLGLPWKIVYNEHADAYYERVERYRTEVFLPKYHSWNDSRVASMVVSV